MNELEQRIAIAKACGWTFVKKPRKEMLSKRPAWHITDPSGNCNNRWYEHINTTHGAETSYHPFEGRLLDYLDRCKVPDYLNDLNAMHGAENTLTDDEDGPLGNTISRYRFFLNQILDVKTGKNGWRVVNASAAQKAEAFLRALNLWKK